MKTPSYSFADRRGRLRWALLLLVGWCLASSVALAAPPTAGESAVEPMAAPAEADPRLIRARQVAAFIEGALDPGVDARALFVLDLDDPVFAGAEASRWLALVEGEAPADDGAAAPGLDADPAGALEAAYRSFFALPAESREALFEAHARKQAEARARQEAQRERTEAAAIATRTAARLEDYLEGRLDTSVDPASLIRVDLTTLGTPPGETEPASSPPQARLEALFLRYAALSADEREALRATHRQRVEAAEAPPEPEAEPEAPPEAEPDLAAQAEEAALAEAERTTQEINDAEAEAEQAATDREAALEAARRAKTEARRMFEKERARLLAVKEAQALYEADISRRKSDRTVNHERALEWSARVGELAASTKYESEKAAEADPLYEGVRAELAAMRGRLREELQRVRDAGATVPTAADGRDHEMPSEVPRDELEALRRELDEKERELAELEREVSWTLASGLRDDVVLLNRVRLSLLELASPTLRDAVTGFGPTGVDQVRREFEQIKVELAFLALKVPRYRRDLMSKLGELSLALLIGLVQLALALTAYLWWRRRGDDLLTGLHDSLRERRPQTRLGSGTATVVWYLRRVRRPLELLLLLRVLVGAFGDPATVPELALLWGIVLWVLLGLAVILFVDGLAARETLYASVLRDTSALRLHSLRVVGLNVIAVGLLLSTTSALVGRGAIHSWVISTCWILSFPVALYLVYRWRSIVFERVQELPESGAFTRWVIANRTGAASFAAATSAAGWLLVTGLATWVMRQLSGLEATRRLLAYLFRREVAKQAAASQTDEKCVPVDPEIYAKFDPLATDYTMVDGVGAKQLESVVKVAETERPTLSAVVGERGAGKSVFLTRLKRQLGEERIKIVSCPETGYEGLEAGLAAIAGTPGARGDALAVALRKLGRMVIAVDDLQRLVVPAVNGLRGLDQFATLERAVGGNVSWVVTIGSASWHYIQRARGDRVFFEQVVKLPRWTEEELGELIQAQCERAGVDPSFEGLVVPRQTEAPLPERANRTEAGYYRLLWDHSHGNPGVALHAFRESLFVSDEGETVVRLFREPSPQQIEDLSAPLLFVLRSVVQLELATAQEIVDATQFPLADVEDAVRFCLARGYLERHQTGVRVTWPWYRTITRVLERQHLLPTL